MNNKPFFTIKDHKGDFETNQIYHLLNPTKSNIGKISKIILERVNDDLRALTKYKQWKSSKAVIDSFNDIPDKSKCLFSIFGRQGFYPSVSEELLRKTIQFASENVIINETEKNASLH